MRLPNNEKTFAVKITGERTQKVYEGDFTVKCLLNNAEQIEVALRTDRYNLGSKTLPASFAVFNRTLAELEVRIKTDDRGEQIAPSWWRDSESGRALYDANVVNEVFRMAVEAETAWKDALKGEAEKAEKNAKVESKQDKNG